MDKEILEILKSIQSDMKTMQSDIGTMQGSIGTMQSDIKSMQGEIKDINQHLDRVENKTDRNTILLEDLNKKVEVVAEVQTSFSEQLGREKNDSMNSLDNRLEVIELAVTDTSSRVKSIQKELPTIVELTSRNWSDIVEIKSAR